MLEFIFWFCCWGAADIGPVTWCGQAQSPEQAETFALWAWAGHVDQQYAECTDSGEPFGLTPQVYLCAVRGADGAVSLCAVEAHDSVNAEIDCRMRALAAGVPAPVAADCGGGWSTHPPDM